MVFGLSSGQKHCVFCDDSLFLGFEFVEQLDFGQFELMLFP